MPFSQKTLEFLFENRLQDSREWFEAHKAEYNQLVIDPLKELVVRLTPCVLEIDDQLTTEPRVDKTISRIWRDTRYSHDKSFYRDNMWIVFRRGKMHGTEVPGVYFEITRDGFSYGYGFYHASTGYMNTFRKMITENDPSFRKAKGAFESQNTFIMEGDTFKRPRYASSPDGVRQWLEHRNISFNAYSGDFDLLYSDRLADKLIADYRMLAPVYQFLLHAAIDHLRNQTSAERAASGLSNPAP